ISTDLPPSSRSSAVVMPAMPPPMINMSAWSMSRLWRFPVTTASNTDWAGHGNKGAKAGLDGGVVNRSLRAAGRAGGCEKHRYYRPCRQPIVIAERALRQNAAHLNNPRHRRLNRLSKDGPP